MSSTTEAQPRGQILVIFALSVVVLMLMAALAFDTGSLLLERRTQQNAADAASLAGARFLPEEPARAIAAAEAVATANGFTNGVGDVVVAISVPPTTGDFAGNGNFIEVRIGSEKPSIFGGVIGRASWDVGSRAVAANQDGRRGPFAMLSLDPSGCRSLEIEGQGELISNGNIQVNSTCDEAFFVSGQGEVITAPTVECNITGGYHQGGAASNNCPINEGEQSIPDPYNNPDYVLPDPPIPMEGDPPVIVYPRSPEAVVATARPIPVGCPGSATPATHEVPALCLFDGAYGGTTWRLFPGYYPGGIDLRAGTFYMEPGIYWIGGGGFRIAGGGASVTSVDVGGTTLGGGVLIFNSENPNTSPGQVILQGGDAGVNLWPLRMGTPWDGIVIFQDRDITLDVEIVGASSTMQVRGTIYAPNARVLVQANGGDIITDQVIAYRFRLAGNSGSISVEYDVDFLPALSMAGLVE